MRPYIPPIMMGPCFVSAFRTRLSSPSVRNLELLLVRHAREPVPVRWTGRRRGGLERQITPGRRAARATASLRLPGIRRIDRPGVPAEVLENPLNECRILDARDHPQPTAAVPAHLDVDKVN
jgi:hypothetical protein